MEKVINILLVEDHPLMRQGLRNAIEVEPGLTVIGEAEDGIEAVEKAALLNPDIILMDIFIPRMDGIATTREIISKNPDSKILILTSSMDDDMIIQAVQSGVQGYILKETTPEQLFDAIRCVYNGTPSFSPNVTKKLLREIREKQFNRPMSISLTTREQDILRLIAKGLSNDEIGEKLHISQGTVRSHLSGVMKKMQLRNRSQLVLYAVRNGFADTEDDDD